MPQIYADVDRDKVLKQGVAVADVYQTLQAFLGGLYVNQFNRFGRQWRVFLQAEGEDRVGAERHRPVLRPQQRRRMVPLSTLVTTRQIVGPGVHATASISTARRRSSARPAPGYSSGQAMDALEEVAQQTLPPEMGYDWADLSYQETKASGSAGAVFALSLVFVFLILAALYESWSLPFSRAALRADRGLRRVRRALLRAATTSTSTRRSAWSC